MRLRIATTALLLTSGFATAFADENPPAWALGVDGGTTGIGASLWYSPSSQLSLSFGYASLEEDESYSTDDIDYDGTVDLTNPSALLRWHPFKGKFNIAAGAVFADNQISITGRPGPGGTFEIDGEEYTEDEVGSLTGLVDWDDSIAPYLGIGWAKKPQKGGLGAFVDLGVMFSGSASVALTADGSLSGNAEFQDRLRAEEREVNDEIEDFEVYPVIKVGLIYRF